MNDLHIMLLLLCSISIVPAFAAEKSRLVSHLEAGRKQVVVAYGTSLTANGGWVKELDQVLQSSFPGLPTVINSGGAGKYSEWGVAHLERRVLQKKPDTVFLEFSINDCVVRFDFSVGEAQANLETIIDRILKANSDCEIILMTMTPGDKHPKGHSSYRENVEGHYAMYRSVAAARGLMLIDHYPNWKALKESDPALFNAYVPDSIHPTAIGCSKLVTPVILDALGLPPIEN